MSQSQSADAASVTSVRADGRTCGQVRRKEVSQIRAVRGSCAEARAVARGLYASDEVYFGAARVDLWGFDHHRYRCAPSQKTRYWARYRCTAEYWGERLLFFTMRRTLYWD